jgi:hypothetical protein
MPTVCMHGITVDWGDFGPCQNCDIHADWECPNLNDCPTCMPSDPTESDTP